MTRATIPGINKRIARHGVRFHKGHGYFYFMPLDTIPLDQVMPDVDSVYTPRVTDLTLNQWVEHVDDQFKTEGN